MAIDKLIQIVVGTLAVSGMLTFAVLTVSTVTYLYNAHQLIDHLKTYYPRAWKALGEPHIFWNNTFKNSRAFAAVLDSGVSEEISDQNVAHMLRKAKRLCSISDISFKLSLACILVCSVLYNL
jgi:hypothetical protein